MSAAADWLVVVGTANIAHSSPGKRFRALQILYHPLFSTNTNDYDVGLLRTIAAMDLTGKRWLHLSTELSKTQHLSLRPRQRPQKRLQQRKYFICWMLFSSITFKSIFLMQ